MILRTASATRSIRALLALLLGISLIAGTASNPTSASAASVAKPGATCSKKGATQTIKSIKYTCVKSGKKLVWNKGARVRATTKPPVLVPDTSSQPLSFDNLDTKRVRQAAFAEVTKVVQSMPAVNPNVTVIAGPSLTAERVDSERAGLKRTASFWADLFLPKTAYIGYYTEADLAWVDSAFCQQAAFCPVGEWGPVSKMIQRDLPWCSSAQATNNQRGEPFFNQCLGKGSDYFKNKQTTPHEYTHWVQASLGQMDTYPNWWIEGGAAYFGGALGVWNGATVPSTLDEVVHSDSRGWAEQDLCPLSTPTVEKIADCFRYTYKRGAPPSPDSKWMIAHVSYYMGALATEALVAVKGMDTYKTFMNDLRTKDFDNAIQANYGLTADEFYAKVSKYVLAMYLEGR
ncbi:MAG: hypothetical protein RLZ88_790 [Actinomycetota bacterium]